MANISFSQYSKWMECPHLWYNMYVDKTIPKEQNLNLIFGTAIHEALQEWITILYNDGIEQSESFDINNYFQERFGDIILTNHFDLKHDNNFYDNVQEFIEDGYEILTWIKKNRIKFFDTNRYKLVGIEVALNREVPNVSKMRFIGFCDIVFKDNDTDMYFVVDFKTSRNGWTKENKGDDIKNAQLLLYKKYFAEQYRVPIENVKVEFWILKRKVSENPEFPNMANRVVKHSPPTSLGKLKLLETSLNSFITNSFDSDGSFLIKSHPKTGKSNNKCNFCPLKNNHELCNPSERM